MPQWLCFVVSTEELITALPLLNNSTTATKESSKSVQQCSKDMEKRYEGLQNWGIFVSSGGGNSC